MRRAQRGGTSEVAGPAGPATGGVDPEDQTQMNTAELRDNY